MPACVSRNKSRGSKHWLSDWDALDPLSLGVAQEVEVITWMVLDTSQKLEHRRKAMKP